MLRQQPVEDLSQLGIDMYGFTYFAMRYDRK
jgi:hypothetical protein